MKATQIVQALGVILFALMNLSQVWAEFNSVSFAQNGTVYYEGDATAAEAQKLANYLEKLGADNADMKLKRVSEDSPLVVYLIPAKGTKCEEMNQLRLAFQDDVFQEGVAVVACDDEFHNLYELPADYGLAE